MTELTGNNSCITEKTAVALGLFDGPHSGHRLVVDRTVETSESGLVPAVFTFRTESVAVKHGRPLEYICTNRQKLETLAEWGIRYAYSPDFGDIKNMSGEEFVREILLKKMNAGAVVCGENFRFGRNAECGVRELEEFGERHGFMVKIVEPDGFSSEKYRELLRCGRVDELVSRGSVYSLTAEVVHGNELGRTLDFPTINQPFAPGQLVPARGVYLTLTAVGGAEYASVTNVGVKPTVEKDIKPLAETHILGFSGDLYGKRIRVEFYDYLRGEKKFASVEELKKQVHEDIAAVQGRKSELIR